MVSICIVLPRELSLCQDLVDFFKFFFFLRWECAENLGRVFFILFQRSSAFSCRYGKLQGDSIWIACVASVLQHPPSLKVTYRSSLSCEETAKVSVSINAYIQNKLAKVYLGTSCYLYKNMKLSFLGKIFTQLEWLHNYLLRSIWLPHFFLINIVSFINLWDQL